MEYFRSCSNSGSHEIDLPPDGMPSPPHREVGDLRPYLVEGEWEMILNAMVWTEGRILKDKDLKTKISDILSF